MDIILDAHCHTIASGHAYSTITEYVYEAKKKGLKLLAVTDHAPALPGAPKDLYFMNLKVLPKVIDGIEVLTGVELNILDSDGSVDLKKSLLKRLDVVIASLHPPCFIPASLEKNTSAVINTMHNPLVKVIGHLGDPRYPIDYKKVVAAAKETNTAIEINNASLNPISARFGGQDLIRQLLELCKEWEVPVIIGSDAHFHMDLGVTPYASSTVEESGLPPSLLLNSSLALFKNFFEIS